MQDHGCPGELTMEFKETINRQIGKDVSMPLHINGNKQAVFRPTVKSMAALLSLVSIFSLFAYNAIDTVRTVPKLKRAIAKQQIEIDTIKIDTFADRQSNQMLLEEILRKLDPENCEEKISRIKLQRDETAKELKIRLIKESNDKKAR